MKVRRVEVRIYNSPTASRENMYTFSYPEAEINFRISNKNSRDPDDCMVKIFGVKRETYALFKIDKDKPYTDNQLVEIYYGYDNDLSLCYSGYIDRAVYSLDGLTLMLNKNTKKFKNMVKSFCFTEVQTLKSALDFIANEFGYTSSYENIADFSAVSVGRVALTGTFEDMLVQLVPKPYGYYMGLNTLYVYKTAGKVESSVMLFPKNGLLAYPQEDTSQKETGIRSVLIPSIESGCVVSIPVDDIWFSENDTGKYKRYVVDTFSSVFQNGLGTTEMQCSILEEGK